ncbi:ATP-binding protein [Massilia sp. SYSU DXS3249]
MQTRSDDVRIARPTAADVNLLGSHPVVGDRAYLPTPPIRRAYLEISEAVAERDSGISFVAFSRFGKTFAISVLADQLAAGFPAVPVLCVNAKGHARYTEATFYSELLEGCTRTPASGGNSKAGLLRSKLIRFLWTLAESRGSDRIVLFVDEAQNWNESELTALRDISNDLALFARVLLLVHSFGAPSMVNLRSALLQAGRTDLVGRFMVRQYEFQGIGSVSDLIEILKCYDDATISEYPASSGVSYSAFFMPLAFRDNWRLEKDAGLIWECFQKAARAHGGFKQIGMKWVASSIRRFLMAQSEFDRAGFRSEEKMWERAIGRSGFVQTLGVTYSSEASIAAAAPAKNEEESEKDSL